MPIARTLDAGVSVLTIDLGRGNVIDHAFMDTVSAALDASLDDGARSVVITGRGKIFSGGLDLVTLSTYDRAALGRFMDAFEGFFRKVVSFPRPLVAAVNGHALAGGCILAMAADHRIMQPGAFQIGVNEVTLGIPFPATAFEIVQRAIPAAATAQVLMQGRRFSPEEAVALGLVHALAGERGCLAEAVEQAQRFAAGGLDAVADTKADGVAPLLARIDATAEAKRSRFLERWFSPEAQARIAAVRAQLTKR